MPDANTSTGGLRARLAEGSANRRLVPSLFVRICSLNSDVLLVDQGILATWTPQSGPSKPGPPIVQAPGSERISPSPGACLTRRTTACPSAARYGATVDPLRPLAPAIRGRIFICSSPIV